ncbi:MAG: type II toxin-antitoxin system Phd/YefM family antitoxin [marine benthic group bacterium]|nr:type II toxin-antitoxin system Phd/YefM family antitoxin [Gemmatimonadota bacterium]
MFRVADIFSLSDFQRATREHIRRLRETGRPEVLTVNGRAELVVYDAATYQEIADRLERRERYSGVAAIESTALEVGAVVAAFKGDVDRTLLRENLRRTVQERVNNLMALQRLASEAKRAGDAVR